MTLAKEERTARGLPTIDLTETNPARVGLAYPEEELAELLRHGASSNWSSSACGRIRGIPCRW